MDKPTSILEIENIECYAYHGCLPEETKIGGRFSVNVTLQLDAAKAIETDELIHTADYLLIHNIVREQMKIPSNLIEHAAGRILKQLQLQFPFCSDVKVKLTKFNPPVNGQIEKVSVILHG